MADVYEELRDWSEGVMSAVEADRIPNNASPEARNTSFVSVGDGVATFGTRPGLVTVNATALAGNPTIQHIQPYSYENGGAFTDYLVLLANNGKLYYKTGSDTLTAEITTPANFPSPSSTCFTTGNQFVDGTVMNNRVFLVNNVGERRSLLNQTHKIWGGAPIATWVPTRLALGGSSSMPVDTYDFAITSYDDTTGRETNSTAIQSVTTTVNTDRITVTITPTATETAQSPYWRVHVRRNSTQSQLYQVQRLENAAGANIVTNGNIPIATTTVYVDLSAAEFADHILVTPSLTENTPPPSDIQYVATYGRRLLAATKREVVWSKLDVPDSFPVENTITIDTGEGDEITGLVPFSSELLLIFTRTAVMGLYGNDPQYWTLQPVNMTIGCAGRKSVVSFDSRVAWWNQVDGPVMFDGQTITRIGLEKLGKAAVQTNVEPSRVAYVQAGWDPENDHVLWSISDIGESSRNTYMLPYNYRLNKWESSRWDPLDGAALSVGYTANKRQRLFVGGYSGQLFYFDTTVKNDGVDSGTVDGIFTPATASITTITDTSAAFLTTGSGLLERYVTITDVDNVFVARRRISSNTATVVTLASAVADMAIGQTYHYYIAGPDVRVYTKWFDMGHPFLKKRFDRVYLHIQSETGAPRIAVGTQLNFDRSTEARTDIAVSGDVWDNAVWDASSWAATDSVKRRLNVWRNSPTLQIGIFHYAANVSLSVLKIAILARVLSDRGLE